MVKRKTRRQRRGGWRCTHRIQLETGFAYFYPSWGHLADDPREIPQAILDEVIEAWNDLGELIEAEWNKPGERPFAWWLLDAPERRDRSIDEYTQLKALELITPAERDQLRVIALQEDLRLHREWFQSTPFRRSPLFWDFVSPEPRDASTYESGQLIAMDVLTAMEEAILEHPEKALSGSINGARCKFYYLDAAERAELRLSRGHTTTGLL